MCIYNADILILNTRPFLFSYYILCKYFPMSLNIFEKHQDGIIIHLKLVMSFI